jgi:aminopeptidase N
MTFPLSRFRLLVFVAIVARSAVAAEPTRHFPTDRPVDMLHIRLDSRVDLKAKSFKARATLDVAALRDVESIQLNAVGFDLRDLTIERFDGSPTPCDFDNDGEHITLSLPEPLAAGQKMTIQMDYTIKDPPSGLSFFAPSEDDTEAPYLVWSQGESITNRYWVPCFDHPDEMQTTEIVCTVDEPNTVLSNGRLVEEKKNSDGTKTYHWLQDKPHVAYLMTLVVGEFFRKTEEWRGKPVSYYVRHKFKDQIDNSFHNTRAMLDYFSDKIGVEYPWDKYAQVCCYNFGGGMENTSATTLTESTLHDDRAHLDDDSDGLVAHELAHQWWGDLLTCRDWAHIWLNEGFASYFEALWDEKNLGQDEFSYNMDRKAEAARNGGKEKPIVYYDYGDPDEQFDSRAYPKGAWVLHMLRRKLGDEDFWKSINAYCKKFSHKTVETSDLRRAIEDVTGQSLGRFFHDWTERPGHPEVKVRYKWIAEDRMASVDVEQTQKDPAFYFPLTIAFTFGASDPPFRVTHEMTEKKDKFFIPLAKRPTMVRIDPDQAVLMELDEDKPRDLWVAQLSEDPNAVGRIRAAEHFGEAGRPDDIKILTDRLGKEKFWAVQAAIAKALGESDEDSARDALLSALATKHAKARAAIVEALGKFPGDEAVAKALKEIVAKGDPSYRVEANAIRAYADVADEGVQEFLEPLMSRESDNEVIRGAVLETMGEHCGTESLELLIEWTASKKPHPCRRAAVQALSEVLKKEDVSENDKSRVVEAMTGCLKKGSRRLQTATLDALGEVGRPARSALPEIDRLVKFGGPRVRAKAKEIANKIRTAGPPPAAVGDLSKELSELQKECKELRDRLKKIEAKQKEAVSTEKS